MIRCNCGKDPGEQYTGDGHGDECPRGMEQKIVKLKAEVARLRVSSGVDTLRGHPMYQDSAGVWRFTDNGAPTAETWADRPCGHCGKWGNSNHGQPDPCLGQLPGVTNACCGHGKPSESYICFKGGVVVRGFTVAHPLPERS